MRTTLDIDAHLLKRLRAEAERRGIPFKEAVAGALRRGLESATATPRTKPYRMPAFSMGAPRRGVDLDKALAHATALENEEIARKLDLRK
jgi:hypothetical protein